MLFLVCLAMLARSEETDDISDFRLMLFLALQVSINLYVFLLRRISFQSNRRFLKVVE